jgi:acyl-CoA thioesterase FadM
MRYVFPANSTVYRTQVRVYYEDTDSQTVGHEGQGVSAEMSAAYRVTV